MGISFYQSESCRLCGAKDLILGASLGATPPGEGYATTAAEARNLNMVPLELYWCSHCGNIQLGHVIDRKDWYGQFLSSVAYSVEMPDIFPRTDLRQPGCRLAEEHMVLVESVNKRQEVFWDHARAQRFRQEAGGDSHITAINVMANVDNLREVIQGVKMLIGHEGSFTFETGYGLDLLENNLIDVVHHDHLSYFNLGALNRFFEHNGLKITEAQRTLSKGGTLRCVVRAGSSPENVSASVGELLTREIGKLSQGIKLFEKFNTCIKEKREELARVLDGLSREHKKVAGFGASVGSTTLIYTLGLAERLECLFDDNPRRFNLFSPGQAIPVCASKELAERDVDHVLILAWRYADVIMKQQIKYRESGGRFIIFLPEIKIY